MTSGRIGSLRQPDDEKKDSIRFYHNQQTWCYPPHWHMPYEMLMVMENDYDVVVDGTHYKLSSGDLIIIPSGTLHEIIAPQSGERYFFMIDRERFLAVEGFQDIECCLYPYILIRAGEAPQISARFLRAADEYRSSGVLGHSAAHMELTLMLIDIARAELEKKTAQPSGKSTNKRDQTQLLFVDICSYIANHCTEDLRPEAVARTAGYSRYYFERMFSECIGVSFHAFLIKQRLNHCKRCLIQSNEPITSIAHSSGFNSIATFNRTFQAYEGMSPSEYRKLKEYLPYDPSWHESR